MSIFKETFRPFVFKQLRIREAIAKKGNDLDSRFGNPRIDIETEAGTTEKVNIPAGSFFTNTVVRQCTLRMCSGVDLKEENTILEEGSKYEKSKNLVNEGLAIRYILEGGITSKQWDFKNNRNLTAGSEVKYSQPRGNLGTIPQGNFGKHYGASYGDPYIRSDGDGDFGIVPMPGIIDANVRTKSAYGSLREAKVNFVCHNRRQLEIMELLYMRPGYPILLEWGWTPYINNANPPKKEEYFPYITEFFKQESKINDINLKILKRKKESGGNYDGFVGYCKNFDIKSRPDGGYDCSTEIIGMGEVLEGLKGRREGKKLVIEDKPVEVDNLEFFLNTLKDFVGGQAPISFPGEEDLQSWEYDEAARPIIQQRQQLYKNFIEIAQFLHPEASIGEFTEEELTEIRAAELNINRVSYREGSTPEDLERRKEMNAANLERYSNQQATARRFNLYKQYIASIESINDILEGVIIRKGKEIGLGDTKIIGSKSPHSFIRWDFMVSLINKYIIPHSNREKSTPIASITTWDNSLDKAPPLERLQYTGKHLNKGRVLPDRSKSTLRGQTPELNDLLDMSIDPEICFMPHQIDATTSISEELNRDISNVFLNIEFLHSKYKELRYSNDLLNPDFNVFDWIKNVWEGVNKSCSNNHTFVLHTESERPNVARIIDMEYESNLQPDDLFEIKIQSNESIVRDFNFNTTLPNAMGATIAVAAQAPASAATLDAVTFAAFHQNIKFRFSDSEPLALTADQKATLASRYTDDFKNLVDGIKDILSYREHILGMSDSESVLGTNRISNLINSLQNQITSLEARYSKSGTREDGTNFWRGQLRLKQNHPPKSAIIPLNFTALMDGIGGIVIGNVFKVQKNRLPIGYQRDDIAFVVMGEDQKITSGQDWTTSIKGQVILLDIPEKDKIIPEDKIEEESNQSENAEALDDVGMEWAMSQLNITPTGIVGRGADRSFEIRISNQGDKPITFDPAETSYVNEFGSTVSAIIPNKITGGRTGGVGAEYVFNVSNVYMDLDMGGGEPVENLYRETTLISHINFTEDQIIFHTEYIVPTIVTAPGEDPPSPPPTPPTPKKLYINLNELSTGIIDEDGNRFHLYPKAEGTTTPSTSSETETETETTQETTQETPQEKIDRLIGFQFIGEGSGGMNVDLARSNALKNAKTKVRAQAGVDPNVDVIINLIEKNVKTEASGGYNISATIEYELGPSTSSSTSPSNEQFIENYRGYDIYKIGAYYELKVDVISPFGYSTSVEAGDGFNSKSDLKQAIDDDLEE